MNQTEIIVAIIGLLSSSVGAYLVLKRGVKADDAAEENKETNQIYTGYGGLIERLQEDNLDVRQRLALAEKSCNDRIDVMQSRIDFLEKLLKGAI